MVHDRRAVVREGDSIYVATGAADAAAQFAELIARFGKLDYFCINDTSDEAAPHAPQLQRIASAR